MRKIGIEDDIYEFLLSNTREIGENASSILRRLLGLKAVGGHAEKSQPDPPIRPPVNPGPSKAPTSLGTFLSGGDFVGLRQAVERFLALLSWLYWRDPTKFEVVQEVHGKRRIYFAKSPEAILSGGRSTQPQRIPGTPWYVVTNNDTPKKQSMLAEVMSRLRFDDGEIEDAVSCIEPDSAMRRNRSLIDLQRDFAQSERDEQEDPGMI